MTEGMEEGTTYTLQESSVYLRVNEKLLMEDEVGGTFTCPQNGEIVTEVFATPTWNGPSIWDCVERVDKSEVEDSARKVILVAKFPCTASLSSGYKLVARNPTTIWLDLKERSQSWLINDENTDLVIFSAIDSSLYCSCPGLFQRVVHTHIEGLQNMGHVKRETHKMNALFSSHLH